MATSNSPCGGCPALIDVPPGKFGAKNSSQPIRLLIFSYRGAAFLAICGLFVSADVDEAALRAGELIFLLPEQFTVRSVDKMKPVTRLADHRFVGRRRVLGLRLVQPMLHVQTGMRTFENDITHKPGISDGFRPLWS